MKSLIIRYFIFFVFIALTSCNEGLAPPPPVEKAYIGGLIRYINGVDAWPQQDSVVDIRVAAFKVYPPKDIITEITAGNAYFTESMQKFVASDSFNLQIPYPPEEIMYLVVAQQYGSLFEWRAIGVWTISGDVTKPSSILVEPGISYLNLDINVDFDNLPPQPFE